MLGFRWDGLEVGGFGGFGRESGGLGQVVCNVFEYKGTANLEERSGDLQGEKLHLCMSEVNKLKPGV